MGFQLKDFVSITASMVNYAKATQDKLTDFNVGSVNRTILESSAIEIEELYQRVFAGIVEAIPTAIYRSFQFETLAPAAAQGTLLITYDNPPLQGFVIPAETIFRANDSRKNYASTADVVVQAGEAITYAHVVCTEPGIVGNMAADTVLEPVNFSFPVSASVRSSDIATGTDGESDEERLARFNAYILSLNRGTISSVVYAASMAMRANASGTVREFVTKVGKREQPGFVDIYLWGSNGLPSDELVAKAQTLIDGYIAEDGSYFPGYAPAGVLVVASKMAVRAVDISLLVQTFTDAQQSESTKLAIREQISDALEAVQANGVLTSSELANVILAVSGVKKVTVLNGENFSCEPNEALTIGALEVGWVDA